MCVQTSLQPEIWGGSPPTYKLLSTYRMKLLPLQYPVPQGPAPLQLRTPASNSSTRQDSRALLHPTFLCGGWEIYAGRAPGEHEAHLMCFFPFSQGSCTAYSVQSLSRVRLSATSWTTARQASLSITSSQSLLKLMSIESVVPSNHLILCRPLLLQPSIFPSIRGFSNESARRIRRPSIGVSASASVLPMNTQD